MEQRSHSGRALRLARARDRLRQAAAEAARTLSERAGDAGGSPTHAEVRAALAACDVASGDRDRATGLLADIDEAADPLAAGLIHAALGERDRAFEALAKVERWRSITTEHIRYFFPDVLGPLREDPRFEDLLRKADRNWGIRA